MTVLTPNPIRFIIQLKICFNKCGQFEVKTNSRKLRNQGFRVTPQRMAVLKALEGTEGHLTPRELYQRLRLSGTGVSVVTVYRNLAVLVQAGLICEVELNDGARHYTRRSPETHHHHLVCLQCGTVADFNRCALRGLEKKLAAETGFLVQQHRLEFYGLCPGCHNGKSGEVRE